MAKKKTHKNPIMAKMPCEEVLAEGRKIVSELMDYLGKNKLYLMFDPDNYKLRLGPDGVAFSDDGVQPKGKIPYTQEEDDLWQDKYSLGIEWGEFDPDNFDDEEIDEDYCTNVH